jgi:hypothetical protein
VRSIRATAGITHGPEDWVVPWESVIHDTGQTRLRKSSILVCVPLLQFLSEENRVLVELVVSEGCVDRPRHGYTRVLDEVWLGEKR